jgi:hypothetical protein
MNVLNDTLLIASAPAEVLLGLGIFFVIAAVIVLLQSTGEGRYPEFRRCIIGLRAIRLMPRRVAGRLNIYSTSRSLVRA